MSGRALLLAVAVAALPTGASAQALWINPDRTGALELEVLRPNIENSTGTSAALYLGIRAPLGSHVALVGEVPFAHGDFDVGPNAALDARTTLGNPYVGVEIGPSTSPILFEFGVRLPVLEEVDAGSSVGFLADPIDRPEAFLEDLIALSGRVHFRRFSRSGLGILLHAGATGWIASDAARRDLPPGFNPPEDEVVANAGARLTWSGDVGGFVAGVSGRANVSDPDGSIGERALAQVAGAGWLRLGPVRPGVEFRIPLDDGLREVVDATYGASLVIELR